MSVCCAVVAWLAHVPRAAGLGGLAGLAARRASMGLSLLAYRPARPLGKNMVTTMKRPAMQNIQRSGKVPEK